MKSSNIKHDPELCGREVGDGATCGKPAVVWAFLDGDDWTGYQATACAEHRDELLDHPSVRVSSDALLLEGDEPR